MLTFIRRLIKRLLGRSYYWRACKGSGQRIVLNPDRCPVCGRVVKRYTSGGIVRHKGYGSGVILQAPASVLTSGDSESR